MFSLFTRVVRSGNRCRPEFAFDVEKLEDRRLLAGAGVDWSSLDVETLRDTFGGSIALDGDTMVVGAPGGDMTQEHATVFVRGANGQWSEQATLTGSEVNRTGQAGDDFGWQVAIDGDTIVVGSSLSDSADGSIIKAGAAYVYTRSGTTWTERAVLRASDAERLDEFGTDVAIEGNTIVVGARGRDNFDGAGFIFTGSGGNWTESFKVNGDGVFGQHVGVSGDTAVFSAQGINSVYVYAKTANGSWAAQDTIVNNQGSEEAFGFTVALEGDYLVVGATPRDGNGSAYVYKRTGSDWAEVDALRANDGDPDSDFGSEVAIQGDTILVGDYGHNLNQDTSGAFYIFQSNGNDNWSQVKRVKAPQPLDFGGFGGDLAIDNGTIATLEIFEDNVFVFEAGAAEEPEPIVSASLVNGALLVTGTELNDKIRVLQKGDLVTIKATKFSESFNAADFNRIVINAGDGNDSVTVSPRIAIAAWISGEAGNDKLKGGLGNDIILGGSGKDLISSKGGMNTLRGGLDDDRITGGKEVDLIYGDEGADKIKGGNGSNVIYGGAGNDVITGGRDDDEIHGDDGDDIIKGGAGNDMLYGDMGNDKLIGAGGDDGLFGGPGDDDLKGGPGENMLVD